MRCETFVLVKKDQIQHIFTLFNSFDKNLRLTVGTFGNCNIRFLDIKILNKAKTNIYIKDTNTCLYVQYNSYTHWYIKTARVRSLYNAQKE